MKRRQLGAGRYPGGSDRSVAALAAVLVVASVLAGCAIGPAGEPHDSSVETEAEAGVGAIALTLGQSSRTIRPTDAGAYSVASYVVTGDGPDGSGFDSGSLGSGVYERSGLAAGLWSISVQGYNSGGHLIASQGLSLTVEEGSTASQSVALSRTAGEGTIDVTVFWTVSEDYDGVSGSLTPVGGSAESLSLSISGGTRVEYLATRPAGDYLLAIQLRKLGAVVDTVTEAVQVYEGYTSAKTVNRSISAADQVYAYSPAAPVYAVDFGASTLSLTVTGATGKSVYLVKANVAAAAATAQTSGGAASAQESTPYDQARVEVEPVYQADAGRLERLEHERAAAFNTDPPPLPRATPTARALAGLEREAVSYGPKDPALTVDSSTRSYWVENAAGAWIQLTATLRAAGQYCYVWVDNANYDNGSVVGTDNKVTTNQANTLRDRFDGSLGSSYSDGIFRNVTGVFGYEYGGGTGGTGGRDQDQHISILLYDIDADYSPAQSGGVLGYFWGKDYYDQAALDPFGVKTNYAELFYTDAHFADRYAQTMVSTLAHEFQHMINFNVKSVEHGLSSPTWYDEMCSMVAEDLVCANIGLDPEIDGAISRLPEFCFHYAESGVSDWLPGSEVLKSYASAFAFGAYLERNYGGASLFQHLLANDRVGVPSITAALWAEGHADTFDEAFRRYTEALVFTDIPVGSSVKTLDQTQVEAIAGITYAPVPVDFDGVQQYDLDSGWVVGAYGPRVYDASTAVDLRPYGSSIHSRPGWRNLAGDLALLLTAPTDPDVKLTLMVR